VRRGLATLAAVIAALLASASPAAAAEEIGDRCVGDDSEAGWTTIVENNGNAFPLQVSAIPERSSVVTRWRTILAPGTGPVRQQMLVFRDFDEKRLRLLGEGGVETLYDGVNEFPTRIPIPEYGKIGLRGPEQTLFCDEEDGHIAGIVEGPWGVGEPRERGTGGLHMGVPAIAILEPDRDNDGYGDETQDGCIGEPRFHGICPIVSFSAGKVQVKRRAALVTVGVGVTTVAYATPQVVVAGDVALPKRRQVGAPGPTTLFHLDGGVQEVPAGGPGVTFRLPLPPPVVRRLEHMSSRRFLTASLVADTINSEQVAGRAMSRAWTVKLRGRLKPPRHRR
jgi:hypothetical protein